MPCAAPTAKHEEFALLKRCECTPCCELVARLFRWAMYRSLGRTWLSTTGLCHVLGHDTNILKLPQNSRLFPKLPLKHRFFPKTIYMYSRPRGLRCRCTFSLDPQCFQLIPPSSPPREPLAPGKRLKSATKRGKLCYESVLF